MSDPADVPEGGEVPDPADPRNVLSNWANQSDEWARFIVRHVLSSGAALTAAELDQAYALFRQEKAIDTRVLPPVPPLAYENQADAAEKPLVLTRIAEVTGVNAIVSGSILEPHAGITIIFGENGTGKTGYARIFKALADSRTADEILGDIEADEPIEQSAKIEYTLGGVQSLLPWKGERGQTPFTRMSIFDSPSVNFHVDDDLEYSYVPTVLALFTHVVASIKEVQARVDACVSELTRGSANLLTRFPKESSVYPLIETLGASTDLTSLRLKADGKPQPEERIEILVRAVGALDANTLPTQIRNRQRSERVLDQAKNCLALLSGFDIKGYNEGRETLHRLREDHNTFRAELFGSAQLPSEPDESWQAFVSSGDRYREHLEILEAHDSDRCLYCRQKLDDPARALINKYREFLEDKINTAIQEAERVLAELAEPIVKFDISELSVYLREFEAREDKPTNFDHLLGCHQLQSEVSRKLAVREPIDPSELDNAHVLHTTLTKDLEATREEISSLESQNLNRSAALIEKRRDLAELRAAIELSKSWAEIETQVTNAKVADRLRILLRAFPNVSRSVTDLAKAASDQLINQNFEALFAEECAALRAPVLKVEYLGRQGKAQRRKVLKGKYKPSKILSEGEQKVLAMADFLAEARLAGITAPVIFDDPVSSLDHRRVTEVAKRVALLAEANQVIVFTHDIFFTTTLLSLFEQSKRCVYYQVSDESGKGKITKATGPRWDTLASLKKHINETITAAKALDGESRAALVRTGYDWIRSWCEVFTETELLKGVTQRYQPNVRMTVLPQIKSAALPAAVEVVTRIFDEACRYIDGHSQPLPTLGVSPTLAGLESHWEELQSCKKSYDDA